MAFKFDADEVFVKSKQATGFVQNKGKMPTISVNDSHKRWFGYTAEEYKQIQEEIYSLGQLLTANFFIKFESYKDGSLDDLLLFSDKMLSFLATETNIPLFQANFEQIQAGAFQINRLSGLSLLDLQINMIETANGDISKSLIDWLGKMVNKDGTINPPASYAGIVTIGIFSKDYGLSPVGQNPIEQSYIVAPSASMIDSLNSVGVSEALQIPMTLTVLREFME
ncbi:hypothetical protein [Acinetobacter bereziniae]|uniref:hypothetical protein n=1 Tax=Acinetobacter bereziniae TaxID=106648 RepID=UPI00124F93BB|nr:hypothetical protein [Acinetobacter bereziniae]